VRFAHPRTIPLVRSYEPRAPDRRIDKVDVFELVTVCQDKVRVSVLADDAEGAGLVALSENPIGVVCRVYPAR
jgi:hypothetical protein